MRWFMVCNVHETVRPFLRLLRFTGLAPFSLEQRQDYRWLNRILKFVYVVVYLSIYSYAIYTFIFVTNVIDFHLSVIIGTMECIHLCCQYFTIVFAIFYALTLERKIVCVMQLLHEWDMQLCSFSSAVDHRQLHLYVTTVTICTCASYVVLIGTHVPFMLHLAPHIEPSLKDILPLAMFGLCYLMQIVQFLVFLLLIKDRYCVLNRNFRMYFPTNPSAAGSRGEFAICSEKEQINVLKQIKILHDKLNDVVELVNYCFSVQITFCVGLCFVIGVVCSFGLFRAFIYRNELFYMGVLNFIWYMYYLFFVLFFIAVGSKISREGKRIGVLVHKAINCSSSSAVINELNLFSQQLLHRSPVITCGLFVYDWTLWYTMIGATATYLIILIQFDVSFPNLVNLNATGVYRSTT
uniref:Gustatory receptor n=1 Tax=Anopheles atroparvus TaxID=41427 RepID=A0AAG5D4G1_ANOAO